MDEQDFNSVVRAYKRGDPRPLAEWVLNSEMANEQRKFVAQALLGSVEKIDGRKVKPLTESIESDYVRLQILDNMMDCLGEPRSRGRDAQIARALANKYGFNDPDSVRRALNRYKKKMKDGPIIKKRVLVVDEPGHEKK